jgi:hypothetical protein
MTRKVVEPLVDRTPRRCRFLVADLLSEESNVLSPELRIFAVAAPHPTRAPAAPLFIPNLRHRPASDINRYALCAAGPYFDPTANATRFADSSKVAFPSALCFVAFFPRLFSVQRLRVRKHISVLPFLFSFNSSSR